MWVLILIVVDNGLVLANVLIDGGDGARVLILVVVDNGLVLEIFKQCYILRFCLNPYCGGQWSRTSLKS